MLNEDVHSLLADQFPSGVHQLDYILSIDSSITSIIISNWTCNETNYLTFDFSRFTLVESIEIGDDCFGSVETFKIDGLNRLKTIKIGNNSFTQMKNVLWDELDYTETNSTHNELKSFHILNCESLESIHIGECSFSDFTGDFEMKNLPQLQSIQIGIIGTNSYNFFCSSLVIRGLYVVLNMTPLDLPNLQSITLGDWTFANILSAIFESLKCEWRYYSLDLPSLQSIQLGWYALHGRYDEGPCYSLTMRSSIEMI